MRIMMMLFGTRGDIQPYVALGKGLLARNHSVKIVTHPNFETFITDQGLDFYAIGGDATQLILDLMAAGQDPVKFMRAWLNFFNPVINEAMAEFWEQSADADALLYNPFGAFAYHVAEARGIPAISTALWPFERTGQMRMFMYPRLPLGAPYNRLTFIGYDFTRHWMLRRYFNPWRVEHGLAPNGWLDFPYRFLNGQPVLSLFGYSPLLSPRAMDWGDHIHVTGFWFLDLENDYQPPQDLLNFLNAGEKPVYIGFGSLSGNPNYERLIDTALAALERTGQRGIIVSGWGDLSNRVLPDNVFVSENVPHDWLFPRVKAVVHHGGAGTTSAGLRAGVPTIILPYFGDQPFWGECVEAAGVGVKPIHQNRVTVDDLTRAIQTVVTDTAMQQRAAQLGEQLRAEDGVGKAVKIIEQHLNSL